MRVSKGTTFAQTINYVNGFMYQGKITNANSIPLVRYPNTQQFRAVYIGKVAPTDISRQKFTVDDDNLVATRKSTQKMLSSPLAIQATKTLLAAYQKEQRTIAIPDGGSLLLYQPYVPVPVETKSNDFTFVPMVQPANDYLFANVTLPATLAEIQPASFVSKRATWLIDNLTLVDATLSNATIFSNKEEMHGIFSPILQKKIDELFEGNEKVFVTGFIAGNDYMLYRVTSTSFDKILPPNEAYSYEQWYQAKRLAVMGKSNTI